MVQLRDDTFKELILDELMAFVNRLNGIVLFSFFNIGKHIHEIISLNKSGEEKFLVEVSNIYRNVYGDFFSVGNLELILKYYKENLDDFSFVKKYPITSWHTASIYLKKNESFSNKVKNKQPHPREFVLKHFFQAENFKSLYQLCNANFETVNKGDKHPVFYESIDKILFDFKTQYEISLNSFLLNFFWRIGKLACDLDSNPKKFERQKCMEEIRIGSPELYEEIIPGFEVLKEFFTKVKTKLVLIYLGNTLTWNHIKIILPKVTIEKDLVYYAEMVFKNSWSVQNLKVFLEENDNLSGSKIDDEFEVFWNSIINPPIETIDSKSGKKGMIVNLIKLDYNRNSEGKFVEQQLLQENKNLKYLPFSAFFRNLV